MYYGISRDYNPPHVKFNTLEEAQEAMFELALLAEKYNWIIKCYNIHSLYVATTHEIFVHYYEITYGE